MRQQKNGRWEAKITIAKKSVRLGTFDTVGQAEAALDEAARKGQRPKGLPARGFDYQEFFEDDGDVVSSLPHHVEP